MEALSFRGLLDHDCVISSGCLASWIVIDQLLSKRMSKARAWVGGRRLVVVYGDGDKEW